MVISPYTLKALFHHSQTERLMVKSIRKNSKSHYHINETIQHHVLLLIYDTTTDLRSRGGVKYIKILRDVKNNKMGQFCHPISLHVIQYKTKYTDVSISTTTSTKLPFKNNLMRLQQLHNDDLRRMWLDVSKNGIRLLFFWWVPLITESWLILPC